MNTFNDGDGDDRLLSAPGSKTGRLQRACLDLLRRHEIDGAIPTNGRFLFYELEQAGVIPKKYLDEPARRYRMERLLRDLDEDPEARQ